jgi:hypothetical protein
VAEAKRLRVTRSFTSSGQATGGAISKLAVISQSAECRSARLVL